MNIHFDDSGNYENGDYDYFDDYSGLWRWLEEKGAECEAVSLSPPEETSSTHNCDHHYHDDGGGGGGYYHDGGVGDDDP